MPGVKGRSGGHNRKSRELHVIQGTFKPSRHAVDAPDPPAGTPIAPGVLGDEAQAEWTRMVSRLTESKTLSTVDGGLLWNYCQLWADACRLVATAYSDMVLLDEPWTKRVRALRLPTNRVRAYYEGDLDLFLRDFATGLLPVNKAASPKSRPR